MLSVMSIKPIKLLDIMLPGALCFECFPPGPHRYSPGGAGSFPLSPFQDDTFLAVCRSTKKDVEWCMFSDIGQRSRC